LWHVSGGDWQARLQLETERYGHPSSRIGAAILKRNELPASIVDAVGATLGSPDMGPLDRATVFARHAAPELLDASRCGQTYGLSEALMALADEVGLDETAWK